ncbi:MAG: endo alpha-1,4 polygalactosaminidase [Deltaproteobacteria bacterium]|nr:endo alpha-1,4 polygalactosaminidase [Deltaproteobacteria bacterium]
MRTGWLVLGALLFTACGDDDGDDTDDVRDMATPPDGFVATDGFVAADGFVATDGFAPAEDAATPELTLPPANAGFDYQLSAAYDPPSGVTLVIRDRNASPAPGIYNVCYVNGFQTQPDEEDFWSGPRADLLLRDGDGDPVIDPDWDEILLDVTTADKRGRLADIVGGWIDGCADDGFDAVEIDNLDTYARSGGRISQDDAVAFVQLLVARAHARGMALAQKNSAEIVDRRAEMGTDFAVVEECNRYDECDVFTGAYGDQVFVIEYRRGDFDTGCADFPELSIVLRDLNLVGPGAGAYVYDGC